MSDEPEADFRRSLELIGEQTGDRWLPFADQVALLLGREPMSIGRAQAMADAARNSGEVRWQWFRDDGLLSKPTRGNTFLSETDLIDWLNRNRPPPPALPSSSQKGRRYTDDDDLVAEGVEGIKCRTYANAHRAAQALAPRAQGSSDAAKIDRLERKIADRLNPETSRDNQLKRSKD